MSKQRKGPLGEFSDALERFRQALGDEITRLIRWVVGIFKRRNAAPEKPTEIKYIIHPGHVTSRHDGDEHYIGVQRLMRLYGVSPRECIIEDGGVIPSQWCQTMIHLYPKYSGDYELPKEKANAKA